MTRYDSSARSGAHSLGSALPPVAQRLGVKVVGSDPAAPNPAFPRRANVGKGAGNSSLGSSVHQRHSLSGDQREKRHQVLAPLVVMPYVRQRSSFLLSVILAASARAFNPPCRAGQAFGEAIHRQVCQERQVHRNHPVNHAQHILEAARRHGFMVNHWILHQTLHRAELAQVSSRVRPRCRHSFGV